MKRLLLSLIALLFLTVDANAAARFLVACATTCTWDGSTTSIWSTTSGGAGGSSVPGSADDVTLDANSCSGGTTCTITVNTTVTVSSLKMGACTASTAGCILDFSVNNNNVNISGVTGLSVTGSGVRTLKMGNGTWTISYTASGITIIDFSVTTNLTLTPGTSTIKITGTTASQRTFATGARTFANLFIDANPSGGSVLLSQNAATFTNVTMVAPTQLFLPQSNTTTATSLTMTGTSSQVSLLASNNFSTRSTISVASGTQTLTWIGIDGVTFTGGATFIANNSFNLGPNSGITINAPASFGGSSACILGGWLLWRDFDPAKLNDNFPAFLEKAG